MFGKPKKDKDTKAGGGGRQRGGRGDKPKHTSGLAGLMGMDPGMGMAEGGNDDDFEAELAKLTGMGGKAAKSKVILINTNSTLDLNPSVLFVRRTAIRNRRNS